jgi:hypothetical protein
VNCQDGALFSADAKTVQIVVAEQDGIYTSLVERLIYLFDGSGAKDKFTKRTSK